MNFQLRTEFIELAKLLKATGLCGSGGIAKHHIHEGKVKVDGKVVLQKGAKIRPGQKVEFLGEIISVEAS